MTGPGSIVPQSLCWLPGDLCPWLSVVFEWPQSWVIKEGAWGIYVWGRIAPFHGLVPMGGEVVCPTRTDFGSV